MDTDLREARRVRAWFAVRMRADEGDHTTAVSQDVSEKGILLAARKRLPPGTPVRVSLHLTDDAKTPRVLQGCVVREEANHRDPGGLWPYRLAIEFSAPDPGLPGLVDGGGSDRSDEPAS